jgi:hypothetical protein
VKNNHVYFLAFSILVKYIHNRATSHAGHEKQIDGGTCNEIQDLGNKNIDMKGGTQFCHEYPRREQVKQVHISDITGRVSPLAIPRPSHGAVQ